MLKQIEGRLTQAIHLFNRRLEWLTTESRRLFGVIEEKAITIVLDIRNMSPQQFDQYRIALETVIYEQLTQISKFNLIRLVLIKKEQELLIFLFDIFTVHFWKSKDVCIWIKCLKLPITLCVYTCKCICDWILQVSWWYANVSPRVCSGDPWHDTGSSWLAVGVGQVSLSVQDSHSWSSAQSHYRPTCKLDY